MRAGLLLTPADLHPHRAEITGCSCALCRAVTDTAHDPARHLAAVVELIHALRDDRHHRQTH